MRRVSRRTCEDGPLLEEQETEGQRQLHSLLLQQLHTDVDFDRCVAKKQCFAPAALYRPFGEQAAGVRSLSQFQALQDGEQELASLRELGLTDAEIQLWQSRDAPEAAEKSHGVCAAPGARQQRLQVIREKIEARAELLSRPQRFAASRPLSRREMEIERALFQGSDRLGFLSALYHRDEDNQERQQGESSSDPMESLYRDVLSKERRKTSPRDSQETETAGASHLPAQRVISDQSEGSQRDSSQSEDSQRDSSQSEGSQRDSSQSEDSQRDSSQSEGSQRETSQSEDSQRDSSQSEGSQRETSQSEDSQRDSSQSKEASKHESKPQDEKSIMSGQFESSSETSEQLLAQDRPPAAPTQINISQPIGSLRGGGVAARSGGPLTVRGEIETISDEEIVKNRDSEEAIRSIPRFRNYQPGKPSKVLCVKNLSAQASLAQLVALFSRFERENEPPVLYRLLTGRMKGQAFISLPDAETAQKALQLVHGYRLLGKPLVVEFGRERQEEEKQKK